MKKSFLFLFSFLILFLLSSLLPVSKHKFLLIVSGSMNPAIKQGSVVMTFRQKDYERNDVVTFIKDGERITHRIYAIENEEYITKGDANPSPDLENVKKEEIIGRVYLHIPYIGYLLALTRTPLGIILLVSLLISLSFFSKKK